jgi:Tfp pilus assembly protein PilN
MTQSNDRLNRIEQILESNARATSANTEAIAANREALAELTQNVNQLTSDTNRVLARSAVLDDILLGLHGNQQRYESKADEIMEKLNEILEKLDN